MSGLPDTAIGMGEMTGVFPKGSAEERKALSRAQLSFGHAFTGARMNPAMQNAIKQSQGGMASGDPQLMAKGFRGAAGILGQQIKTAGAGFQDETRSAVHDRLGEDPNQFYSNVYKDPAPGAYTPKQMKNAKTGATATSSSPQDEAEMSAEGYQ